jgi:hypothetical protein
MKNTTTRTAAWCFECRCNVRGSQATHIWTAKHQRQLAGPVLRRHSAKREVRATQRRLVVAEPFALDDPTPTWKTGAGIPSLGVERHFEPLELFARNVAYADGFYVRCRSCHSYYLTVWSARRAAALQEVA